VSENMHRDIIVPSTFEGRERGGEDKIIINVKAE
jgi:hypothetical protein